MNYLLVKPEELDGQGYDCKYAERIPDGRVILPLGALKVLSSFSPEILSDDRLKALIKEQKESGLYDYPQEDGGDNGEEPVTGGSGNDSESPEGDIAAEESAGRLAGQEGGDA